MTAPLAANTHFALHLLLIAPRSAQAAAVVASLGVLHQIEPISSAAALRAALRAQPWDAAVSLGATGLSHGAALKIIDEFGFDLPLVVVADAGEESTALRAMNSGARDAIDIGRLERLLPALEREIREARHRADHRAALEMLKSSESRFRALASNLPGMLFQLQRTPSGDYRFLYVSEGCQKLFGLKPHEIMGSAHRFFDVFDAEDRAALNKALRDSAEHGTLLNWEGRTRGRARSKWLNLRSTPSRLESGAVDWQGMATNITHSKEIEGELRGSRQQLAELSTHLEVIREEERERIARDIHDELGSILVRLKIEVALISSKLPDSALPLREKAHSIEGLLDQAMSTASRVARELRPGILKEFGLTEALEQQAEDFSHRVGVPCRVQCDDDLQGADDDTSLHLFRIAQEALTNIAKHAHASLVVMRLRRERGNIVLEIRDNGRGISEADMMKPKSFGLRGIRERVLSLAGEFQIGPAEHGGTHIVLRVPELPTAESPREEEPQGNLF